MRAFAPGNQCASCACPGSCADAIRRVDADVWHLRIQHQELSYLRFDPVDQRPFPGPLILRPLVRRERRAHRVLRTQSCLTIALIGDATIIRTMPRSAGGLSGSLCMRVRRDRRGVTCAGR